MRSDYVSLSVPLTAETRGMIGPAQLARMNRGAVLVNLSRGGTVDTEALVEALSSGHLAGAALDVFDPEPLPDGHVLFELDNVVLTPHIGGWVADSFPALARTAAREMLGAPRPATLAVGESRGVAHPPRRARRSAGGPGRDEAVCRVERGVWSCRSRSGPVRWALSRAHRTAWRARSVERRASTPHGPTGSTGISH